MHKPKGRAQTRTSTDRGAEPSFLGRQAEQAFSQSAVPNPWAQWQTRTSIDQDQHGPTGRALFPRQTRTSGSMLTGLITQEVLEHLDLGQYDGYFIIYAVICQFTLILIL